MNAAVNARTESQTESRKNQKTDDGASVAEIFSAAVAFAASRSRGTTLRASCAGWATEFEIDALRAAASFDVDDANARNAAFVDALRGLRTRAARFDANFDPSVDPDWTDAWTRLASAAATGNETLRERFLTQAEKRCDEASARATNGRFLWARFATALTRFYRGDAAGGFEALDEVATTPFDAASADGEETKFWACWRARIETRDFLAALAGRPLLADFWRGRAAMFEDWGNSFVARDERRQALEIARATARLAVDFERGVQELTRAELGCRDVLREEIADIYEKTFGERRAPSVPTPTNRDRNDEKWEKTRRWSAAASACALAAAICVAVWGNASGAAKVGETVEAERAERVAPSGERGEAAGANGFDVWALR